MYSKKNLSKCSTEFTLEMDFSTLCLKSKQRQRQQPKASLFNSPDSQQLVSKANLCFCSLNAFLIVLYTNTYDKTTFASGLKRSSSDGPYQSLENFYLLCATFKLQRCSSNSANGSPFQPVKYLL